MTDVAFELEAALPLANALVESLARASGTRVLAIKGLVSTAQGLRAPTLSADIDVLIEPARFSRLCDELESAGWYQEAFNDTPGIVPQHALTFRNRRWPCEIDAHRWFPGFLADPAEVFEVLWGRRTSLQLAHQDVTCTDVVASTCIAALNQLRASWTEPSSYTLGGLVRVVRRDWDPSRVLDLAAFAADVGAGQTLRPFLDAIDAPDVPPTRPEVVPYSDWQMLSETQTLEVLPWIVGLLRCPWRQRPAFIWRAIWLPEDRFRAWQPALEEKPGAVTRARLRRLRRGLSALPGAWREYRRLQGQSHD